MEQRTYGDAWFQHSDNKTNLIGCRCENCESYWFPNRHICPNCFGENLKEETLTNIGKVYSFTKLHIASKGFDTPLTIAYVDFPEGIRVCGQVEEDITIGSMVETTYGKIRTDSDGLPVFSYKFKVLS